MASARKLTLVVGILAAGLGATRLAAQDNVPAPTPQVPMMGQGMMQQMSQMMETCNRMMQAQMAQPPARERRPDDKQQQ